jgi:hypothetical protein
MVPAPMTTAWQSRGCEGKIVENFEIMGQFKNGTA